MAAGDRWVRASNYHEELYRNGTRQPYTLCAVKVGGRWMFELWELERLPRSKWDSPESKVIARGYDAAEVRSQLPPVTQ